ncbi:MAG TPA: DNA mismatch repair protein MutS, partial [Abditibacterium sp.]
MSQAKQTTPFMRQWERAKAQHPDTLLLFRMGDFYEMFGDDAKIVARECEITLTARDRKSKGDDAMPMCGVPHHSVERHIVTLLSRGYRLAVCEQMEDPKYARGLVKREVVRVLSPGTVMEDAFLSGVGAATGNNYLAALATDAKFSKFGLALLDISTGEFLAGEIEGQMGAGEPCEVESEEAGLDVTPDRAENTFRFARLREELLRFAPAEILVPQKLRECPGFLQLLTDLRLRTTAFDASGFDTPRDKLLSHFKTMSLRGFGLEDHPLAQESAALALDYLKQNHLGALGHLRRITLLSTDGWMILDNATRRNLELAQSIRDGSSKGTLLELLDETRTGAGSRLLRKWILQPLLSKERIERRQDAVSELRDNLLLRRDCRDLLKGIGDIERLVSRAVAGNGNARDLVALQGALQTLPALQTALQEAKAPALTHVSGHLNPAPELLELLQNSLADDPPALLTEGGLIREGYDSGLDELREISREGKGWVIALEEAERARTGIPGLKVGFNNVFGYFIEITKSNLAKVPADYTRKQTTANGERFITP